MKNILIGFISCLFIIFLCSYTFKVGYTNVNVRTIYEDGHKYVVATTYFDSQSRGGVSIIHSHNCQCLKSKN